jgi:hypothetical protein
VYTIIHGRKHESQQSQVEVFLYENNTLHILQASIHLSLSICQLTRSGRTLTAAAAGAAAGAATAGGGAAGAATAGGVGANAAATAAAGAAAATAGAAAASMITTVHLVNVLLQLQVPHCLLRPTLDNFRPLYIQLGTEDSFVVLDHLNRPVDHGLAPCTVFRFEDFFVKHLLLNCYLGFRQNQLRFLNLQLQSSEVLFVFEPLHGPVSAICCGFWW